MPRSHLGRGFAPSKKKSTWRTRKVGGMKYAEPGEYTEYAAPKKPKEKLTPEGRKALFWSKRQIKKGLRATDRQRQQLVALLERIRLSTGNKVDIRFRRNLRDIAELDIIFREQMLAGRPSFRSGDFERFVGEFDRILGLNQPLSKRPNRGRS